jgi:serine phosphatase RsbU (regulator of sigma subunit)/pSer/pThr/pTyr-binding forkhead associated (FHA) protein
MPTILILNGARAGTHLPILGERFTIGRDPECDGVIGEIVLRESVRNKNCVSRRHATLTLSDGEWYIEDGDGRGRPSRNGTSVNGRRLAFRHPRILRDNDRIRICDVKLSFHSECENSFTPEVAIGHSDSSLSLDNLPADNLRILLEISAALRGTLDQATVLDRTLEHLFRLFPRAERGLVVFRDRPSGTPVVRAMRSPRDAKPDSRFSTTVIRRCLESVEAILGNDLPVQFPDSESLCALSVRSLMCAPLWTPDGKALGVIQLDTTADGRKFLPDDLRLLLGVANQASIALSNARLLIESLAAQRRARDLELAQQVQRALLPRSVPSLTGYTFQAHYAAADEVGGDYYDFIPLKGGRLAVLLGDVVGHGVAAALVMARFGAEARACLEADPDPQTALARMNTLVRRAAVPESFVTLAVVVLDPDAHRVQVLSAGHPLPLVRRADATVEEIAPLEVAGFPLGIAEIERYECHEFPLNPGESVLLFSDGLTEAMDSGDRPFGTERVRALLAAAGPCPCATGAELVASVRGHIADGDQNDDITFVCFCRMAE